MGWWKPTFRGPVLLAAALHLALMAIYVHKYNDDVSALVGANYARTQQAPWEHVRTGIGPGGYDGMFYYAIARNPWMPHVHDVDSPAYRHSRIFYTSLCWLLSGGNGFALVWVMPAVNLLAIVGMAWLGAWVADRYAMSPWWGFVVPLAVNACIPALRDLTDGVSTLMVFALLATGFLQRR